MVVWNNYNPDDFDENGFGLIPEGKYRVRIEQAEDKISSTGKDMIKLTLAVSGYNIRLWSYIVLDSSSPENIKKTNRRLGFFWNSFNITPNNMDEATWIGRVGGVKIRHSKDINDNDRADVQYFLVRKEVDKLPAWQEGSSQQSDVQENIQQDLPDFEDSPSAPVIMPF